MTNSQVRWARGHDWFRRAEQAPDGSWRVWIDAAEYRADGSVVELWTAYTSISELRADVGY